MIPGPLVVGLTGGIGSGKSLAVAFFEELGARVIVADELVDRLLGETVVLDELQSVFGEDILGADGIDRRALADRVFSDRASRRVLEMILHPRVAALAAAAIADAWAEGRSVVLYEVPLLLEIGAHEWVDQVVVVEAPESVRVERLVANRGYREAQALARIRAQVADHAVAGSLVLDNGGTREDLRRQVEALYRQWSDRRQETFRHGAVYGKKAQ